MATYARAYLSFQLVGYVDESYITGIFFISSKNRDSASTFSLKIYLVCIASHSEIEQLQQAFKIPSKYIFYTLVFRKKHCSKPKDTFSPYITSGRKSLIYL